MKLCGAWVVFIFSLIFSAIGTLGKLFTLSTGVCAPLGIERSWTPQISSQ